jgi:hypothetical protein
MHESKHRKWMQFQTRMVLNMNKLGLLCLFPLGRDWRANAQKIILSDDINGKVLNK